MALTKIQKRRKKLMREIEWLEARKLGGDQEAEEKMAGMFDEILRMEVLARMGISCEEDIPREEEAKCFTTTQRR